MKNDIKRQLLERLLNDLEAIEENPDMDTPEEDLVDEEGDCEPFNLQEYIGGSLDKDEMDKDEDDEDDDEDNIMGISLSQAMKGIETPSKKIIIKGKPKLKLRKG